MSNASFVHVAFELKEGAEERLAFLFHNAGGNDQAMVDAWIAIQRYAGVACQNGACPA